jgi:3-deoxy-manno-octulosonate cytidylyltransferase (CMP-KDO synthetase)
VQGDEPLIAPPLAQAVARLLQDAPDLQMSTAAHPIHTLADFQNPNVVKVVLDARGHALYFSRAPIPVARDRPADRAWWMDADADRSAAPLRHIGIYGYRVGFLRRFPTLQRAPLEVSEALEQLRAMWHGYGIAVHLTPHDPGPGVDTPQDLERVRQIFAR